MSIRTPEAIRLFPQQRGGLNLRWGLAAGLLLMGMIGGASAQLEEVFSKHVRIYQPKGPFPQKLIRMAPGGGGDWRSHESRKLDFRVELPANLKPETAEDGCVLRVALSADATRPQPIFRIDRFQPAQGDVTEIDEEYAAGFAEDYSQALFEGKFKASDSGMLDIGKDGTRKTRVAMVGGTYLQGAAPAYRVQCTYLSADHQFFITFDCSEGEWPRYQDTVAAILLSLEIPRRPR